MRGVRDAHIGKNLEKNAHRDHVLAYQRTLKSNSKIFEEKETHDYLPLNFNSLVQYFYTCNQRKEKEKLLDNAVYLYTYIYIYKYICI